MVSTAMGRRSSPRAGCPGSSGWGGSLRRRLQARDELADVAVVLLAAQQVEEAARVGVAGETDLQAGRRQLDQRRLGLRLVRGRPGTMLEEGALADHLTVAEGAQLAGRTLDVGERHHLPRGDDVERLVLAAALAE